LVIFSKEGGEKKKKNPKRKIDKHKDKGSKMQSLFPQFSGSFSGGGSGRVSKYPCIIVDSWLQRKKY
jgi:hypothetical protein